MRHLVFSLVFALGWAVWLPAPARAQLGATTTRLALEGQAPRFYPTYGHGWDPEIYAPLAEALAAMGLQFRVTSLAAEVTLQGKVVATWPVVRTAQALPKTGRPAAVLAVGDSYYVPVRAAAGLLAGRARRVQARSPSESWTSAAARDASTMAASRTLPVSQGIRPRVRSLPSPRLPRLATMP